MVDSETYINIYDPHRRLKIEDKVGIAPFVTIGCKKSVTIGHGTTIASGVTIVDHDHNLSDPEKIQEDGEMKDVIIGKRCWIGANAVILKGVVLGDNCVVGAGSVVTRSFPSDSIIVGNPARLLKKRTYENISNNTNR